MKETFTSTLTHTQSASRGARCTLLLRNLSFWCIWRGAREKWSRIGLFCALCGDQIVLNSLSIYGSSSVSFGRRSSPKHLRHVISIPNLGSAIALIQLGDNLPLFRG